VEACLSPDPTPPVAVLVFALRGAGGGGGGGGGFFLTFGFLDFSSLTALVAWQHSHISDFMCSKLLTSCVVNTIAFT
jgi:hypothetical protein